MLPILLHGVPPRAQPLIIAIAILRDDCRDPLGMFEGHPEANRRTIVENIDRESLELEHFREPLHRARQVLKRVLKSTIGRHRGLAEARQIRRDQPETTSQSWHEITKHV